MPFILIIIGASFLTASVRGNGSELAKMIDGDFTGQDNFTYWVVAIIVLGSLGYVKALSTFSTAFMALVLVVLVVKTGNPNGNGGGLFSQLNSQVFGGNNGLTAF